MTPLVLLVGFLGSGKTTYLQNLLPALQSSGLDPYVIINDYQNARVDAALVTDLVASVVPISGSCVCCGSREELLEALRRFEHAPGRLVVIETNGTTDSEELIELLSLEASLQVFTLPIQLSVIDGKRWQKRFWHNSLEREQARTANYLFVSRLDEVDDRRAAQVSASLRDLEIDAARKSPEEFATELATIAQGIAGLPSRDVVAHPCDCDCGGHDDGHHHAPERHAQHHFASVQIALPPVVSRASLQRFLIDLPAEVIRAKGVVRLSESPDEYHVFQKVEGSVQLLPIGPRSRIEHSVAILIGPRIPEEKIREAATTLFETPPDR